MQKKNFKNYTQKFNGNRIKNLKFGCLFHLIVSPIFDGIPKRENIQTILLMYKHPLDQIQMGN
jgi:hypothetical protein